MWQTWLLVLSGCVASETIPVCTVSPLENLQECLIFVCETCRQCLVTFELQNVGVYMWRLGLKKDLFKLAYHL